MRNVILTLIGWLCMGCPIVFADAVQQLRVADVDLDVRLDDRLEIGNEGHPWRAWLRTSLLASHTVTGGFPIDRVRIDLKATSRADGSIAFGQVRRSTPPRIRFYVAPDARLEDLNADWRGYHEFAHLLIPFPGNDDIWFTEGFASYYQYLLQSRAGVVPEREAWQNLLDGFRRGLDDRSGRGRTLRSLSPDMWRERAFRRVYWTGAAFFLRVDTRLRTETGGAHSLDSALAAFHECCMFERRRWSAERLVERLGELSVPEIWRDEYARMIDARAKPEFTAAFERLGLSPTRAGLSFSDDPAARALRRAIAGPRHEVMLADSSPAEARRSGAGPNDRRYSEAPDSP